MDHWRAWLGIVGVAVCVFLLWWLWTIFGAFAFLIPVALLLLCWSIYWLREGGRISTIGHASARHLGQTTVTRYRRPQEDRRSAL